MATIKDVAKLAGVSTATVSLVINGKAKEMKVAEKTRKKVLEAVKTLDYKPNLAARRLKSSEASKPTIALYWPLDYRTVFLARLLSGIQREMKRINFDCDVVVNLYENDKLHLEPELLKSSYFNAAIIGGTSEADNEHLKSIKSRVPIILFNRRVPGYSSVCSDDSGSAEKISKLLWAKGHSSVAIFNSKKKFHAMNLRTQSFIDSCKDNDISADEKFIITTENSYEGGAFAASRLLNLKDYPKALYCDSDIIALGATHIFNKNNVRIPDDIEIISIGMSDREQTKYSTPPLTVASIPTEEMAASCVNIISDSLKNKLSSLVQKKHELELLLRDSCRP